MDYVNSILNERLDKKPHIIAVNASYQGLIIYGKYQFSFGGNNKNDNENIGFLVPHSGRIIKIILKPHMTLRISHIYQMTQIIIHQQFFFLTIVVKKLTGEAIELKTYHCRLHYNNPMEKKKEFVFFMMKMIKLKIYQSQRVI